MATRRQRAMAEALRGLAPLIPLDEARAVLARANSGTLRELSPNAAIWLALGAHARHVHTDYDQLLQEGYDRDAARHFVVAATEERLAEWGCARLLLEEDDDRG